jgi:hypothetical protein
LEKFLGGIMDSFTLYRREKNLEVILYYNTKILASCEDLLLFLDNFYKFQATLRNRIGREKIIMNLGLFGRIFTTITCNIDLCSWHISPCDLEFAVLVYARDWQRGCLNIRLPKTTLWFTIEPMNIVFLKGSWIFYNVQKIKETRKSFSFYNHLIKGSCIRRKGKCIFISIKI